jgi:hypothetical protein
MAYELRPNSGTLFRNLGKKDNPKAPDFKGDALIEVNGQHYQLDIGGWTKQTERAGKFLSLSIKLKGDRDSRNTRLEERSFRVGDSLQRIAPEKGPIREPGDEDIPF